MCESLCLPIILKDMKKGWLRTILFFIRKVMNLLLHAQVLVWFRRLLPHLLGLFV